MNTTDILQRTLVRDRALLLAGVVTICALAWIHVARLAHDMESADMVMAMPHMMAWTPLDLVLLFIMWSVMMVAMMLPSATPMILLFASITRHRRAERQPHVPVTAFVLGYLVAWSAYSAVATLAQWGLHSAALLSPMMVSTSGVLGGTLLLGAGAYQWTSLKGACLRGCRSPLAWLATEWRDGSRGAFMMGLRHGGYCVGCCWALMALLFVAGVMNLMWVAALAGFVLLEKIAPAGPWVPRAAGTVLAGWGLWLLAGALF